jgi:hypothetical protein
MKNVLFLMVILLCSCTTASATPNTMIWDEPSCGPLCWNNIVVGKTTKSAMIDALPQIKSVEQDSITTVGKPWMIFNDVVRFNLSDANRSIGKTPLIMVQAFIANDKVVEMSFCGDLGISFGQAVYRTGVPKNIITMYRGEQGGMFVIALNPPEGIEFSYHTRYVPTKYKLEINPDIQLRCLIYFDPPFYEKMLEVGLFSEGYYNGLETTKIMYPWNGYGSIDDKYPLRTPAP